MGDVVFNRTAAIAFASFVIAACGIDAVGALEGDAGVIDSTPTDDGGSASTDSGNPTEDGAVSVDASDDVDGSVPIDGGVTLTVAVTGTAAATKVTSNVGGISCPPACSAVVAPGTNVTLSVVKTADEALVSWSGACSGRDPSCALTVSAPTSVGASFAPLVQYVQSPSNLYTVNGATGAPTLVATFAGACSGVTVGDIAVDRTGKAYAITLPSGGANSTLHVLTLATASCGASLGDLGRRCNALTFAPNPADATKDSLFAACGSGFYRVDVTNAATTSIGALVAGNSSGDIVWMPGRGVFITIEDGTGTDKLAKINLGTGAATVIGTGVGQGGVYALGHRGDKLLGYGNGFAITIDPATGGGASLNAATNVNAYGAMSAP